MPYSSTKFKNEIRQHLLDVTTINDGILDVGPGCGAYGLMLKGERMIDAIEIFEEYITRFNLKDIYNNVYNQDIMTFGVMYYDYIILGDVLEHLSVENALTLIDRINVSGNKCLVAVPYLYEQGESEGNVYETHLQPDLTPEKMKSRYPSLKLLYGDEQYGYYVNY